MIVVQCDYPGRWWIFGQGQVVKAVNVVDSNGSVISSDSQEERCDKDVKHK
jgi:hypothetical protein